MRRIGILCFTEQGSRIAETIRNSISGEFTLYGSGRVTAQGFLPMEDPGAVVGELFQKVDALVFVGACGIAVRLIAPYLRDKFTDPAVVVADETGRYVISLLSGHAGGANALTKEIAGVLSADPVITTATDLHRQFAVDVFAKRNGLLLTDRELAKAVSSAVLHGEPVGLISDYPIKGDRSSFTEDASLGILISHKRRTPFFKTLWLRPKNLVVGIGCKKGVSLGQIEAAVEEALRQGGYEKACLREVRSVDRKGEELALLAFCKENQLQSFFYTPEVLRQVPGNFTPSPFVEQTVGVDNVCERSAAMGGSVLRVRKVVLDGVTAAIGELPLTLEL